MPFAAFPGVARSVTVQGSERSVATTKLSTGISIVGDLFGRQVEGMMGVSWRTVQTDEEIVSCWVEVLQGAVKPERHTTLLAIHVSSVWDHGSSTVLSVHGERRWPL